MMKKIKKIPKEASKTPDISKKLKKCFKIPVVGKEFKIDCGICKGETIRLVIYNDVKKLKWYLDNKIFRLDTAAKYLYDSEMMVLNKTDKTYQPELLDCQLIDDFEGIF